MKKRILSVLLALCLIFGAVPVFAAADVVDSGPCGDEVNWEFDGATLTISGAGPMNDYGVSTIPWKSYRSQIQTVVIEKGVTSIGNFAFTNCSRLPNITIPEGVTSIGEKAFALCRLMPSITIPDTVKVIGPAAFYDCSGLTGITIPASVESIENDSFQKCGGLEKITVDPQNKFFASDTCGVLFTKDMKALVTYPVGRTDIQYTIPDGVTSIGENAFYQASNLTGITIPASVTSIGDEAFYDCSSLTGITLPKGVTNIGYYEFCGCTNLASVTIPDTVKVIEAYAFADCSALTDVYYSGTEEQWDEIEIEEGNSSLTTDAAIQYNSNSLVASGKGDYGRMPWKLEGTTLTISFKGNDIYEKSPMDYIGNSDAHVPWKEYSKQIQTVVIGDGITNIGDYAFRGCSNLTSVTIPNSVANMGSSIFRGCTSLTSVTMPASLTSIGNWAFGRCPGLTSINIPNGVTSIGVRAFSDCTSLTSVTMPASLTSIGKEAFYDCSRLTNITIPKSVTSIGTYAFYKCSGLTNITIPNGITSIEAATFYGCSGLTSITIPNGVTSIGTNAFDRCSGLTSITIPKSVTSIGIYAFNSCSSLTDVHYSGTETQWKKIDIDDTGNSSLTDANIHYNGTGSEEKPTPTPTPTPSNPFTDVKLNANGKKPYYYDAVLWAVREGITTGTSKTTFSPANSCTRAQIVTFLWRNKGRPSAPAANKFTDMPNNSDFIKAINWAVNIGVTKGTSQTTFSPNATCTRAEAVTFIWRAMGKPPASKKAGFTDMPSNSDFQKAISWAVEKGITKGTSSSTFSPNKECSRGDIVTFLYRARNKN